MPAHSIGWDRGKEPSSTFREFSSLDDCDGDSSVACSEAARLGPVTRAMERDRCGFSDSDEECSTTDPRVLSGMSNMKINSGEAMDNALVQSESPGSASLECDL